MEVFASVGGGFAGGSDESVAGLFDLVEMLEDLGLVPSCCEKGLFIQLPRGLAFRILLLLLWALGLCDVLAEPVKDRVDGVVANKLLMLPKQGGGSSSKHERTVCRLPAILLVRGGLLAPKHTSGGWIWRSVLLQHLRLSTMPMLFQHRRCLRSIQLFYLQH